MGGLRKAVFLDRDGVINMDHGYLYRWEDFEFVPGSVDAMRRLQEAGYALVVVTNQSGIARGYYTEADFHHLSAQLCSHLAGEGVVLDAIEFCPHLPGASVLAYARECSCRKPAPGMLLTAAERLGLDLSASVMFGDKPSDLYAARAAGVSRCALLASNGVGEPALLAGELAGVPRYRSLSDAVAALLSPIA